MKSSQIIYPPYNIDSLLEKANEELDCLINGQRGTKEEKKDVIWCDKCGCVFSHEPGDSYIGFSTGNSIKCPNCNKLLKANI